jgi:SAM-dependent methyltransferase
MNFSLFSALSGEEPQGPMKARDCRRFGNTDGLLQDPTCFDFEAGIELEFAELSQAVEFLEKSYVLVSDKKQYTAFLDKKTSIVDQKHFGSFHQQLGSELLLRLRTDPNRWWYEQKFDADSDRIKDGLYKSIQEAFLDRYFPTLGLKGKTVLDFGCGSGMAAERFIKQGAHVIGLEPDPVLLKKAEDRLGAHFTPVHFDLTRDNPLDQIPMDPVDCVWLGDVFLFYFYPQDGRPSNIPPNRLLERLTQKLTTGGRCIIMQSHGMFWLMPWLGDPETPYTILTEYGKKLYSVAPGLEELATTIAKSGLLISNIFEPKPEKTSGDTKAHEFAKHFPQWWVFECLRG